MSEGDNKKKSNKKDNKKKHGYTFLMVSNKSGKVNEIHFTSDVLLVLLIILGLGIAGILAYFIHYSAELHNDRMQILAWESQYNETMSALTAAVSENDKLVIKNKELEKQLSRKDYLEQQSSSAEATKYVPSGFPISGQVSTPSKYSETIEGVVFTVGQGAKIAAAGNGKVSSVTYDNTYGYIVVIDHENGFKSYYCYNTEPLVAEGETVSRGQSLYFTSDNDQFTYKISYEGSYIDPNTVIDIDG